MIPKKENLVGRKKHNKICDYCKKEFSTEHKNQKHCSMSCSQQNRSKNSPQTFIKGNDSRIIKNCEICGKEFKTYPSHNAMTCSSKCSHKYQWITSREDILKKREGTYTGFTGKHTEECKKRMSEINKKRTKERPETYLRGSSHPNWEGGKSFEPYPIGWQRKLRNNIRERDGKCMNCGLPRGIEKYDLAVHHIDYNKDNLCNENLIALCNSCHTKTNFNRDKWEIKFKQIMEMIK